MTPADFLELLWAGKPAHLYILVWTLQGKRSHWFQDAAAAAEFIGRAQTLDTYTGVGLSRDDRGPDRRCTSDEIAGLAGFWADFDLVSKAHPNKPLPNTIEEALSIVPIEVPPTIVIWSGNGAHAWWLFKENLIFENAEQRQHAARVAQRWQTMLRLRAASRGWSFDCLADLARVLRLPGTFNYKDRSCPRPVEALSPSDRRYNLSDLEEFLDASGIPREESEHPPNSNLVGAHDTELTINLNAEIPPEWLNKWLGTDERFRDTWFRQRHDLRDQSQSGYDMAIADFGVKAGLTDQQIVDLIVHHRRMHGVKARTRTSYFRLTIGKARRTASLGTLPPRTGVAISRDDASSLPASTAEICPPSAGHEAMDPMTKKVALCKWISESLGVHILRIVKITGDSPTYRMVLEIGHVELTSVKELIGQSPFRAAVAGATNRLIPKFKSKDWEKLVQAMLDAIDEEDAGPESESKGVIRAYLGQYLAETAFISSIEGQPPAAARRPLIIDGRIAVNAGDLQLYINKTFMEGLSVKAVVAKLSALGVKSKRVTGKFPEQGRWLLPDTEFGPAEYAPEYATKPQGAADGPE